MDNLPAPSSRASQGSIKRIFTPSYDVNRVVARIFRQILNPFRFILPCNTLKEVHYFEEKVFYFDCYPLFKF